MRLIAHYPFNDASDIGKDISGNGFAAEVCGEQGLTVSEVNGRTAVVFPGKTFGAGYLTIPGNILDSFSDEAGLTICTWVNMTAPGAFFERIFDFGKGEKESYIFLARGLRGVCFAGTDLAAVSDVGLAQGAWAFITMTIAGTKNGTESSAGPRLYVNGVLTGEGMISQTSSGTYKLLREFFDKFTTAKSDSRYYIGHSQFDADPDLTGAMHDFRIYEGALSEMEILGVMCDALSEQDIVKLAAEKFLKSPVPIVTTDIELQQSLMNDRVKVVWESSNPEIISADGQVQKIDAPSAVTLTALLGCGETSVRQVYPLTVIPQGEPAYELKVNMNREDIDISDTLYGLFFEDINRCADGGIYAEMVQNRSFENFVYKVYDPRSGENGASAGREHLPLQYWFGDTDKAEAKYEGGLNEHFHLEHPDVNACYLTVQAGARLMNRGFCDNTLNYAMRFQGGAKYDFSVYLRGTGTLKVTLADAEEHAVSAENVITAEGDTWKKYELTIEAEKAAVGQLILEFVDALDVDMVSLMPKDCWGSSEEEGSASAASNYQANSNYRLRRDLVEALLAMKPKFLRFPGGCISEGSYIWEDVYDWKDSVGDVAVRKENFNCWGYVMTMGLGYMEYFQLAEDLGAEPLPVMACGVLCQARSDYANPAGGSLRDKYISNFTDLIDFAIGTDFSKPWCALRKEMGHEAPFGLHYLGVGNENWGTEFFANFEVFRKAIDDYMEKHYPGYPLTILSTVGAQADDRAYQNGWRFLAGYWKGEEEIRFTDGTKSWPEKVTWYPYKRNHMDTIADEHFYRANDYLLENVDRYDHYMRAYQEDGSLDETLTPKVFIGEYASSEKNTLSGAIAEAAVMTGFERNSDVVRLAATAPLFNHISGDGTYRWTPDCIWFNDEKVWYTPTYYIQKLFAENIGKKLLHTEFAAYENGTLTVRKPSGGVLIRTEGSVLLKTLSVKECGSGKELFGCKFTGGALPEKLKVARVLNGSFEAEGFRTASGSGNVFYLEESELPENVSVELTCKKCEEQAVICVGTGLKLAQNDYVRDKISVREYCVGDPVHGSGLKVVKDGKEGYTMGDFSDSVYAGNQRHFYDEAVPVDTELKITVNHGGDTGEKYEAFYRLEANEAKQAPLALKLTAYTREVQSSVTADEKYLYLKLVNTEEFDKQIRLRLEGGKVGTSVARCVVTGKQEEYHVPNVNGHEYAPVAPTEDTVESSGDELVIVLPAVSATILKAEKA